MHTFVITGPSGAGKSHLVSELVKLGVYSINVCTDRERRPGETDVTDREYVTEEEFTESVSEFLYWFEFQGNRYGYRNSEIQKCVKDGLDCCLNVTPTHLPHLLEKLPEAVTIYLYIPGVNFNLLFERMFKRDISKDDAPDVRAKKIEKIKSRLSFAKDELGRYAGVKEVFLKNPLSKSFEINGDGDIYDVVLPYIKEILEQKH